MYVRISVKGGISGLLSMPKFSFVRRWQFFKEVVPIYTLFSSIRELYFFHIHAKIDVI